MRVLILSWEYPPLIEGGLARHVRKLSENLRAPGRRGARAHARQEESPGEEEIEGVIVHRVPRAASARATWASSSTWIEHMNADMLAAGVELGDRYSFDVVHGHDWLVAVAGDHLAKRFRCPFVVTIHATEYGRHQGWVDKHPQSHIHGVEQLDGQPRRSRRHLLGVHARARRRHLRPRRERVTVIPNGIDPTDLVPVDDLDALRARFAAPARAAGAAGGAARVREGLPDRARGAARR